MVLAADVSGQIGKLTTKHVGVFAARGSGGKSIKLAHTGTRLERDK